MANFGKVWTRNLVMGLEVLAALPEEQVFTVKYEQILAEPRKQLSQIIHFIDPSL